MKWGVGLNVSEPVEQSVESAVLLETAGIDQLWITDFPADRYAPSVAAAVARATTRCKIGVGLVSPYLYSIRQMTQFMSALIERYGQRFLLLVGPGDRYALERIGITQPRGSLVVEETLAAALDVKQSLKDLALDCPVLLGAQGHKMMEAARETDGVLLNYSDFELAKWAMEQFKGRAADFIMGLFPPTHLGPDAEPGHEVIRRAAALVALGLTRRIQKEFGFYESIEPAKRMMDEHGLISDTIIERIGIETLSRFGLSFTDSQLCDYMTKVASLGYDLTVLGPPLCMKPESIQYLAQARKRCSS